MLLGFKGLLSDLNILLGVNKDLVLVGLQALSTCKQVAIGAA
jgi:hypothetical protein